MLSKTLDEAVFAPFFEKNTKICGKCNTEKPINEFNFYRSRNKVEKLSYECKQCKRVYMQAYYRDYISNPEKKQAILKRNIEWRNANKDKYYKSISEWWRNNPDKKRAKDARRRERGYFKEYNKKNKEKHKEYHINYYAINKEKILARIRKYEESNKDHIKAYRKAWFTPDKQRIANHRRRTRVLSSVGSHTIQELNDLFESQHNLCANLYCKTVLTKKTRAIDHINPLARGGTNFISNLQWLCKSCNSSKGTKSMDEWMNWWRKVRCC